MNQREPIQAPGTAVISMRTKRSKLRLLASCALALCLVSLLSVLVLHSAPRTLESDSFVIEPGMSVGEIARKAEQEGFVRSELMLYTLLLYRHEPTALFAGTYRFDEPVSASQFAAKLAAQEIEVETATLTIPEGTRVTEIARMATRVVPTVSEEEFLFLTSELEGFLFPETYHLPPSYTADELVTLLKSTYEERVSPLRSTIAESELTEYEVITLASIIEREANDETSMRMVSGILQNRLRDGMALQADASIEYDLGKPLSELTAEDLELDSPYNTYLNRGLPPTPIGNPGLTAIKAVLDPEETEYYFYITDPSGQFHYARTFDEHKLNVATYLR